jgi:formate dehydrogenase subunit gamma
MILRFLPGERFLHWALAAPFVLLYATAALMLVFYGEPHPRHFRDAFAIAHRIFGVALVVLPPLALLRGSADWRVHLENMREGWRWTASDLRWLLLFPRNAIDPRVRLPEQGKFNAAEKLNFMMVSTFYPLYIVTGILVWLPGIAVVPYLAHYAMAVLGVPLVLGHIFMATINPDTKAGLSGMITGWVDRNWAKHHYARWYRERFERRQPVFDLAARMRRPARVRCTDCREVQVFDSWQSLVERSFRVEPLFCDACEAEIRIVDEGREHDVADEIIEHLKRAGADEPFERRNAGAA